MNEHRTVTSTAAPPFSPYPRAVRAWAYTTTSTATCEG